MAVHNYIRCVYVQLTDNVSLQHLAAVAVHFRLTFTSVISRKRLSARLTVEPSAHAPTL